MTRECPPQELEHDKTKILPKFQQVPTNVFLFFWANFWHLATHQKNGFVKVQKKSFRKNCSMSPHFEGIFFQIGIFEYYIVQG